MELAQGENTSVLNKFLDELLYFFQVTNYDVVTIEDLDRFNDPEIFTNLRELNNLLNNSDQINRKIVFIYAIRDEMFINNDRAKFFDFIIPVIPVVNPSNSVDMVMSRLREVDQLPEIKPEFISDITLYIDDMRFLKNVITEFKIYRKIITGRLNQENLFGIILYKNLYPKDFSDLHVNKGIIYDAFSKKPQMVSNLSKDLDKKIFELEKQVELIKKSWEVDLGELRSLYILRIYSDMGRTGRLIIGSTQYEISASEKIKQDNVFRLLATSAPIQYQSDYIYGNGTLYNNFSELDKTVNPSISYQERENAISIKAQKRTDELKTELEKIKLQKRRLEYLSLKDLIQQAESSILDSTLLNEKVLVYLLRNGYIDEMYYSYISYFYEGSLTKQDLDFVLAVKNREALPFNYKLTKTNEIAKRLRLAEYSQAQTLNFDLFDFLIKNLATLESQFREYIAQLISKTPKALQFIDEYIQRGENIPAFIQSLCREWPEIWIYIDEDSDFPTHKKDSYLILILKYNTIDQISSLNKNGSLANYLANTTSLLGKIGTIDTQKIQQVIETFEIKFNNLEAGNTSPLLDFVYEKNQYALNLKMVQLFISLKSAKSTDASALTSKNYSTILNSNCSTLISYIEDNINEYVDRILSPLKDDIEEEETAIIKLLNNEEIPMESRILILHRQKINIRDISLISNLNAHILLKATPTWQNLFTYYSKIENNLSEIQNPDLIIYLNQTEVYSKLEKQIIPSDLFNSEEDKSKLIISILLHPKLSNEAFSALLPNLPVLQEEIDLSNLNEIKIHGLIKLKKLSLSESTFTLLKENFPGTHLQLLIADHNSFMETMDSYDLDGHDFSFLLDSDVFNKDQKDKLLAGVTPEMVSNSEKLADRIYQTLKAGDSVIEEAVLTEVLVRLPLDKKISLFGFHVKRPSEDTMEEFLQQLGPPFSDFVIPGKYNLQKNPALDALLTILKEKGYHIKYKVHKDTVHVTVKEDLLGDQ